MAKEKTVTVEKKSIGKSVEDAIVQALSRVRIFGANLALIILSFFTLYALTVIVYDQVLQVIANPVFAGAFSTIFAILATYFLAVAAGGKEIQKHPMGFIAFIALLLLVTYLYAPQLIQSMGKPEALSQLVSVFTG